VRRPSPLRGDYRGVYAKPSPLRGDYRGVYCVLLLLTLLLIPTAARAEQSITINDLNLGIIGEREYAAGFALMRAHPVFYRSDTPFRVTISSLDPNLGVSDDGTYIKPLGDLVWKLSDEPDWVPVTQEDEEVDWSDTPGEGALYVDFVVLLDWTKDVPGRYGARLVFTIEGL
jgi:hypothetical protein